ASGSASGKKTVKRKHVTLTLNQKLQIIKVLERGINQNTNMSEFNIGSSTIYDKKKKDKLRAFVAESEVPTKHTEVRQTLKMPKMAQLDVALFKWFSASGPMLIEKAKEFHCEMNISESCGLRWLHNFSYRHGIHKLDISGEQKSADHVAPEMYSAIFVKLVDEHGLSPSQMYNADETGLLWRCLPNSTLVGGGGGEKAAHGFKMKKDRITVLVCANASGTHIASYEAQGNAWLTAEIFKDSLFNYFVLAVKKGGGGLPEDIKAVILLDNCRAHPPTSELVSGNIFTTYLPANVMSLIQLMDQGMIQNFKCFYRGSFVRKLLNSDCSVSEFQSEVNLKDAVYAAALALKDVKKATRQKCWRKLWPSIMFCDDFFGEEE
uniref:HTH CENPB-type domain-containing protein n=1 Tax=Pelodiscus sinensis TaxID=13735 RepID=K7FJC2_PELSI